MARLTIRELKIEIAEIVVSTAALSGLVALMLGATSCFIGLTGAGTIKLAEQLTPHRNALKLMMFYGSAAVGAGLFSIGAGLAIYKNVYEPMQQQLLEEGDREPEDKLHRTSACIECKNFHGKSYNGVQLICAIHPYGSESDKCPDWCK